MFYQIRANYCSEGLLWYLFLDLALESSVLSLSDMTAVIQDSVSQMLLVIHPPGKHSSVSCAMKGNIHPITSSA